MSTGKVAAIRGVVLDVKFPAGETPEVFEALEIAREGQPPLVLEVQQHLGDGMVRTVAMDGTDGLARGISAVGTGAPIKVPVGDTTLGRVFNVVGEAIDGKPTPSAENYYAIHREAPAFSENQPKPKHSKPA